MYQPSMSTTLNWMISVQIPLLLYVATGTGALMSVTTHFDHRGNNFIGKVRNRFVRSILAQVDNASSEPDLFDYFDPLLSPHAYPKGIVPKPSISEEPKVDELFDLNNSSEAESLVDNDDFGWSSREFDSSLKKSYVLKKPFGISLPLEEDNDYAGSIASSSRIASVETVGQPLVDPATVFDPTLSPHFYAHGRVPDVIVGDEVTKNVEHDTPNSASPLHRGTVGLLLIDHGSRSAESNERLQELARLYQQQYAAVPGDNSSGRANVIVKAAHMEIATPSIADGLASLLEANVEEIICHPYFLSPGRHVVEDIPRIVAAAVDSLSITIPVRTTPPIGSRTNIMMEAIHSLVQDATEL
jgi:CbiX